jgi:hypothetical protein
MQELYKALRGHRSWHDVVCDESIKGEDGKDGITFSTDEKPLLDTSLP